MTKLILFDLAGVIFSEGHQIFIEDLSQQFNLPVDTIRSVFSRNEGELYREDKITKKEFWQRALKKLGLKADPEKLNQQWIDSYVPRPGMKDLLLELKK